MSVPLKGLLLTGGRSRRMQRDKAVLDYGGRPQLERALALLEPLVGEVYVSVRADQLHDPQRTARPCIADVLPDLGPIGGLHAALHAQPATAWLVLACDLPFLDAGTLQQLIAGRAPQRIATAFRSSHDGQPEPLCAIYEPAARAVVDAWIAAGRQCPRALLGANDVELLTLRAPRALDNINTAEEYAQARQALGDDAPGATLQLHVRYFALLREQAGRSAETVSSQARTARELYAQLQPVRGLTLRPEQLRVAINDEFADWSRPLAAGDTVVFLPPVAGG